MPTNVILKNTNPTSTLRVRLQDQQPDPKSKRATGVWETVGVDGLIPPGQHLDVWIGGNRRLILEELLP